MSKNKKLMIGGIALLAVIVVIVVIAILLSNSKNNLDSEVDKIIKEMNSDLETFNLEETEIEEKNELLNKNDELLGKIQNKELEFDFNETQYEKLDNVGTKNVEEMYTWFDQFYQTEVDSISKEGDYNNLLESRNDALEIKTNMVEDLIKDTEKVIDLMLTCDNLSDELLGLAKESAREIYMSKIDEIKENVGEVAKATKEAIETALESLEGIKTDLTENPLPEEISDVTEEILTEIENYSNELKNRLSEIDSSQASNEDEDGNNANGNEDKKPSPTPTPTPTPTPEPQPQPQPEPTPAPDPAPPTPTRPVYTDISQMDTSRVFIDVYFPSYGFYYFYLPKEFLEAYYSSGATYYNSHEEGFDNNGNPLARFYLTGYPITWVGYCDGTLAYTR